MIRRLPVILALLFPSSARADLLGGPGESCRSENDCKVGLKCIQLTCVDAREGKACASTGDCGGDLKCIKNACTSPAGPTPRGQSSPPQSSTDDQTPSQWMQFRLGGTHPFVGMVWIGGPTIGGVVSSPNRFDNSVQGSFLFAVRAGVFIDRHELAIELSPMTYAYYHTAGVKVDPAFQVNATYGHFLLLKEMGSVSLYWPLRFGFGTFFGNTGGDVFFQLRADLVGLAVRIGHLMLDFHAPSYRYGLTSVRGDTGMLFTWEIGAGVSYVF